MIEAVGIARSEATVPTVASSMVPEASVVPESVFTESSRRLLFDGFTASAEVVLMMTRRSKRLPAGATRRYMAVFWLL